MSAKKGTSNKSDGNLYKVSLSSKFNNWQRRFTRSKLEDKVSFEFNLARLSTFAFKCHPCYWVLSFRVSCNNTKNIKLNFLKCIKLNVNQPNLNQFYRFLIFRSPIISPNLRCIFLNCTMRVWNKKHQQFRTRASVSGF